MHKDLLAVFKQADATGDLRQAWEDEEEPTSWKNAQRAYAQYLKDKAARSAEKKAKKKKDVPNPESTKTSKKKVLNLPSRFVEAEEADKEARRHRHDEARHRDLEQGRHGQGHRLPLHRPIRDARAQAAGADGGRLPEMDERARPAHQPGACGVRARARACVRAAACGGMRHAAHVPARLRACVHV